MDQPNENEKVHDLSNILTPKPQRLYTGPQVSPFSQSLLSLSPIVGRLNSPLPFFPHNSSETAWTSLNLMSPLGPDSSRPIKRIVQKIDFSLFSEGIGKFKANSLPVEVKVFQDEAFEHSSLLTSLAKSKPVKRQRAKENSNKISCTCPKSKCLKLYCECFSKEIYCDGCNCVCCHNTPEFESERKEAIENTKVRNPNAFLPKINLEGDSKTHAKGCHCNKSACLKNYCECFQSGVACTDICQCIGCKNIETTKKGKKTRAK